MAEFSTNRRRHIEVLLEKAAQDEAALGALLQHDATAPEVLGFHAQQATEKLLKAAIKAVGMEFPLTHRLSALCDILRDAGVAVPQAAADLEDLTPFAVEFRYDALPQEGSVVLDPDACRTRLAALRAWVVMLLGADPTE